MTEVMFKLNIKALASMMGMTIGELGEKCGCKAQHLKDVSAGRSTMTAKDLVALHEVTGVPFEQIQIEY